ncbi:MAG TPA: aldehyde dehydrogenase family protein [Plantibacter sp.]|uniref:aldehyde dehydrogenase family protein n=1 Tax=Plantibacter sp. TaxID=1871045 RepID=UPI002C882894|nr:aldehyde dehydrogenase family protein [Plantibacter sp.]
MRGRGEAVLICNVIAGEERPAVGGTVFEKFAPATGDVLSVVTRSDASDVDAAISAAAAAQPRWAARTVEERGRIIRRIAQLLEREREAVVAVVAAETGKSPKDAKGETDGAIELGYFIAGEGRRFYGKTMPSATPNRYAMTIRQPLGVAGLIIAANTPIANVAWKVFPALLCGNACVLKASEDTPETPVLFARLAREAGLPDGVLNIVQGFGAEAGQPLVEDSRVAVVSFTGSTAVGRMIAEVAGKRLAKVCLELGGKNPLVVCDDANLEKAAETAALSAFSNAGQRCAAGSRLIVFDSVYDRFRELLLERAGAQKVGPGDEHDFGPVINERQLANMLGAVERAKAAGATVLTGGERLTGEGYDGGFYIGPTIVENTDGSSEISRTELFGPITTLHRVRDFDEALALANASPYGLTAAIWTSSIHRGNEFLHRVVAGGVQVNGPTYGFEPHVPFGGQKDSGTGWREPGTEALDVYSDWKTVYVTHDPAAV